MVDTLKIAEDLERGSDGFTATQARRLATSIGQAADEGRFKEVETSLRSLEVKVGIQAWSPR